MKAMLKRLVPERAIAWLRGRESDMKLRRETLHQMRRFRRHYARRGSMRREHLETRIMFFTHQIEKGLSHTDLRYGFGKGVLEQLAPLMEALRRTDPDAAGNGVYRTAVSALHEYRERHEAAGVDLAYMRRLFDDRVWDDLTETDDRTGGVLAVRAADKRGNASLTFAQLMEARHSVREFADLPIAAADILPAVETAMRTPSVCNRQPTRVHIVTDPRLIERALTLQGGFRGYPTPPALVLITADNQAFMNQDERNEGYTDGGLFGMSLLLALEERGLAACPLNTMLPMRRDEATRRLLGIPDGEFLVMYIAVGRFRDEVRTCKSQRFAADDIVTVHA